MKIPLTPLRFLYRAADLYGGKEGVICGTNRFPYSVFTGRCEKLASALVEWGVRPAEPVGFLSFNTHRLMEGYYGVPMAHGAVMPLNVRLAPPELAAIVRHSGTRLLFYENDFAPLIPVLLQASPGLRVVNLDSEYEPFLQSGTPGRADVLAYDEDAMAELFYTSGSTGTPKGVMLSHRSIYLHAMGVAAAYALNDADVELHTIPLFHANGWGRPQISTMLGSKQVMVRRFDPAAVCRAIQNEKATSMSLVPTMAAALLALPQFDQFDVSSMRQIHIGGAASSPQLIAKLERAFHCEVLSGYGLTETSPVATTARDKSTVGLGSDEERWRFKAMAGWPVPGTEARVVDAAGQEVPQDASTVGEIVIRGDNVMDGYYREPEATAAVMQGAWFHTGDMAVWDIENRIQIVDRKKDIIISGGENISSIEVENAIAAHPAVLEAAVVGIADPIWGEVPIAFVVTQPDVDCTHEMLHAFLEVRLAKFKMPKRYEFVAGPLPKGGTGKILKRELRARLLPSS